MSGKPIEQDLVSDNVCRLCQRSAKLRFSHILPRFAVGSLRNDTGGKLRLSGNPNLRVQDGPKAYLLCDDCEQMFSGWEKEFAEQVFHPYHNASDSPPVQVRYGEWGLKFAVSVSWRVLEYRCKEWQEIDDQDMLSKMSSAREVWRRFLLGELGHPGGYVLHMLPLDILADYTGPQQISPYLNRYITSTFDMDFVRNSTLTFVYVKLRKLCLYGFVKYRGKEPKDWKNTRIKAHNGYFFGTKDYVVPPELPDYLNMRSDFALKAINSVSDLQYRKIEEVIDRDPDSFAKSDAFRAFAHDVHFSGRSAFGPEDKQD